MRDYLNCNYSASIANIIIRVAYTIHNHIPHLFSQGAMKHPDINLICENKVFDLVEEGGVKGGATYLLSEPLELSTTSYFKVDLIPTRILRLGDEFVCICVDTEKQYIHLYLHVHVSHTHTTKTHLFFHFN